ncbi:MAG: radical SAM protein [Acidobacteriota bacterium]|nr:radical SAM protein [Acidobacteriota bacterium]
MRFAKAIIVNPPSPPGYVSNKDSMGGFGQLFPLGATLFPPLDLIYLASYLAEKGCPLEVLECLGLELTKEQLLEKVASCCDVGSTDPALVVIRTSAPTLDWDLSVCSAIKAENARARVGIYGPVVPSVLKRIQEESFVDYIIKGDPDEVVFELMSGSAEEQIRGLAFRRAGEWVSNPDKAVIRDLDSLPFPKWELVPYKKYKLSKSSIDAESSFLPMLTSRGCPIGCHYCPYPIGQGLAWRYRSPQNVVDEIEHLVKDFGIDYILFRDPMFSLNQKRVIEICAEIKRRGLVFKWRCETRVDFLNEQTLRAMAGAGCDGINFGVESSDVKIQANAGRKVITEEQFVASFDLCRRLGIKTFGFFIIGLPGDTVETILKTIKFAIDIKPNWVQFTAASPFIGTKLRDWAVGQGFVQEDEYAYINSHEAIIGNENLSKEQVHSLHRFAQLMQNYLLNRKGILKDDHKRLPLYRAAKSVTDVMSDGAARALFTCAKLWFQRGHVPPPPAERVA